MCNDVKSPKFSRGEIKEAFGLPSDEMTRGEHSSRSRELERILAARQGETTKGGAWKQNSGSVPHLVGN